MKVFVAGGSGTIGIPLVQALVSAGHQVTALTHSLEKQPLLRGLGATPAVADALDAAALKIAVAAARPAVVIHELTALPKGGARRARDLAATNRLRIDGTRNLLDAAISAGARRLIGGSFALIAEPRPDLPRSARAGADALAAMETQILEANDAGRIEGVVLRYGLFYGPHNPATEQMIGLVRRRMLPVVRGDRGLLPCIHVDDAVSATVAALDRGIPGHVYDIVDDRPVSMTDIVKTIAEYTGSPAPLAVPAWVLRVLSPYLAGIIALRAPLSNAIARAELGWQPRFSTWRDGLSEMLARAA
jgi:nucleoside-diphosphate-sugar epimerase